MRDLSIGIVGAAFALLVARTASAAPTVALVVEGAHHEDAQLALVEGLRDDAVLAPGALAAIAAAFGKKIPVSAALANARTRAEAIANLRNASPDVDAVVVVVLRRVSARKQAARIFVVPAHGDVREATVTHVHGKATLVTNVRAELAAATAATATAPPRAPEPEPEDVAPPAPVAEEPLPRPAPAASAPPERDRTAAPARTVSHELFTVAGRIDAGGRRFTWNDALRGDLRDYRLAAAPLGVAEASVYPLAETRLGLLADVGIGGEAARAFALSSSDSAGGAVSTSWSRWAVGPRVRIRTAGETPRLVVTLGADYGRETFELTNAAAPTALPSADYRTLAPSAYARVALGRFALLAEGSYRHVLDAGPMGNRFPHASVAGVLGALGGAFTLGHGLELRAEARYERFFYALNAEPADREVAGGAVDQLFGIGGGLAYAY